ncbi:MAG: ABC transporter permease subunit, partial [Gemmatimonadota bacterium]
GSAYAILSATLVRATPLLLLGLSVATAFRSGILNIGAEGQLLAGAMAAAAVGLASTGWPSPIAVVATLNPSRSSGVARTSVAERMA